MYCGTPLHLAIYKKRLKVVNALIAKGAKLNVIDKNGFSPLDRALDQGLFKVAKLLVDKGVPLSPEVTISNKLPGTRSISVNLYGIRSSISRLFVTW